VKRAIDISVGLLLLSTGALSAWICFAVLTDSFLSSLAPHRWAWSVAILGTAVVLAAIGLLRWRRPSALVGVSAELILATLWFPTSHFTESNYAGPALLLTVAGLVYWRFLWSDATDAIHAKV
jgi:hypothetical protein